MTTLIPRFEFRAFAHDFGRRRDRLHNLATVDDIQEQTDVYLLTPGNHSHSVKVRDNALHIKYLIHRKNGLEQWVPLFCITFPIKASQLQQELFTSLNVVNPKLEYESYGQKAFWNELIKPHPSIRLVHVVERQFLFSRGSCRAEMSNLCINGIFMQTLAIKDQDDKIVQQLMKKLDLEGCENINYPRALEHIMRLPSHSPPSHTWPWLRNGSPVG
jgi:hypothetical protein